MNISPMMLQSGKTYLVKIRDGRTVRRIFKWRETRFGRIPCYVFTSKLVGDIKGAYNPATKELTLSGKRIPVSEVSVPAYDLTSVSEVA